MRLKGPQHLTLSKVIESIIQPSYKFTTLSPPRQRAAQTLHMTALEIESSNIF